MTTKTIGPCLFAALLGIFAGCEQPADEQRECQDFIAAVEDCVDGIPMWSDNASSQRAEHCTRACDHSIQDPHCLDVPTNETIDRWVDALNDGCDLFAWQWKDECESEFGYEAIDALKDVCYRHYFDPGYTIPDCAHVTDMDASLIEATECE